ncbi:MAG: carboxypeptidase-like regulatory domain-containing protein, partial [candidate division Zixibacteria bacterium]
MRSLSSTRYYLKKLGLTAALVIFLVSEAGSQIPCVFGFVLDQNQNPVVDADLDFDNVITGERINTPGDNTDSDGYYIVCVLPAIYNISYAPPAGTNLLGRRFLNVDLTSGQAMELNVTLDYGVVISGTVTDPSGNPVGGVDLDADDLASGARIYTPDDNTDSTNGAYWIVVPPADYRLRFQPPAGSRWVGLQMDSVGVPSDRTIDVVLSAGNLLSGTVTDNIGRGLADISVDLRDQATGEKLYVANNKTDTSGAYNVAVLSGLYRLRFEPPFGSRVVGAVLDSFAIENDVVRNQVLESGWLFSVFVHDSTGAPIPGADLDFIQESTGMKIFTPHDKTDSDGFKTVAVLQDTYTVRLQPPPGSFYERRVLTGVSIASDTTFDFTLRETDRVSLAGRVTDISGIGLSDIDIYFFS